MDLFGTCFMHKLCGSADRPTGADHVIEHQADLSFDRTSNDVSLFGLQWIVADFIDNREFTADTLGVTKGSLDAPLVGTDHDDVLGVDILVLKVSG